MLASIHLQITDRGGTSWESVEAGARCRGQQWAPLAAGELVVHRRNEAAAGYRDSGLPGTRHDLAGADGARNLANLLPARHCASAALSKGGRRPCLINPARAGSA